MRKGTELNERFSALEASPELAALMRREPRTPRTASGADDASAAGAMHPVLMALTVVAVASVGVLLTALLGLFCAPLAVAPIVLGFAALYWFARHRAEVGELARYPLRRVPALVVEEGTQVSSTRPGGDGARYSVTLEAADGSRLDCAAAEGVRGTLRAGDMGVAYLRRDTLLEFARVSV